MDYATVEQFNQLQKRYYDLAAKVERLDEATYKEISQLKIEIHQIRAEMKTFKQSTDIQFEDITGKLDRQVSLIKENSDTLKKHGELLKQILAKLA